MSRKVVVVFFPGAIAFELITAIEVLGRKFQIVVSTPDGTNHRDESGLTYVANSAFADESGADCVAVLVAGGHLLSIKDDAELNRLLRTADQRKVVIGAVCAGPLALAQAGILAGHQYTQAGCYPESDQHLWDGANFVPDGLVVSDNIITALPENHVDFAIEVGRRLGAFESDQAAERKRGFFVGRFERDWSKVGAVPGI